MRYLLKALTGHKAQSEWNNPPNTCKKALCIVHSPEGTRIRRSVTSVPESVEAPNQLSHD
jgi:hypothetical protein